MAKESKASIQQRRDAKHAQLLIEFKRLAVLNKKLFEEKYPSISFVNLSEMTLYLFKDGYETEFMIRYDKAGSFYRVDFANLKKRHVVEIDMRRNYNQTMKDMDAWRDGNLAKVGWSVTRFRFPGLD